MDAAPERVRRASASAAGGHDRACRAFERYYRLQVEDAPDDQRVDLIEAFSCTLLAPLGLRIRFIDTWYHHRGEGGLHCATNTMRRPRELAGRSLRWWVPEAPSHDPRR